MKWWKTYFNFYTGKAEKVCVCFVQRWQSALMKRHLYPSALRYSQNHDLIKFRRCSGPATPNSQHLFLTPPWNRVQTQRYKHFCKLFLRRNARYWTRPRCKHCFKIYWKTPHFPLMKYDLHVCLESKQIFIIETTIKLWF